MSFRGTAAANNLDEHCGRRSHEHTNALLEQYDLKMLWEDYGIVGDVIVSFCDHIYLALLPTNLRPAIYCWFSPCRYPRAALLRSATSGHQRSLQRPPHYMGWPVPSCRTWEGSGCGYNGRY
jgi:hypothetical protein